jgi:hypothetical protein
MSFQNLHSALKPHCLVKADLKQHVLTNPSASLPLNNPFAAAGATPRRVTLAAADAKLRLARSADSLVRTRPEEDEHRKSLKTASLARSLEGRQRSLSLHNPFRELAKMADKDV